MDGVECWDCCGWNFWNLIECELDVCFVSFCELLFCVWLVFLLFVCLFLCLELLLEVILGEVDFLLGDFFFGELECDWLIFVFFWLWCWLLDFLMLVLMMFFMIKLSYLLEIVFWFEVNCIYGGFNLVLWGLKFLFEIRFIMLVFELNWNMIGEGWFGVMDCLIWIW